MDHLTGSNMPKNDGLDELRDALRHRRLVPVVGAGVSMAAAKLPDWRGLIRHGIDFAEASGGCTGQELQAARACLAEERLLNAAQELKKLLRAPGGGQYAAWLENVFRIPLESIGSKKVLNQIADLLCPIVATTNYDDLLEQVLLERRVSVTWREPLAMQGSLAKGGAVFHLHGIYRVPKSVVLGADNYDQLVSDPAYRGVLQTLWIDRTLLFIGCSPDGLQDPDFARMLQWFSQTFPGAAHRHYALMLKGSYTTEQQARWLHDLRLQIIPYGPTHEQLPEAISAFNVNAQRAYVQRIYLVKDILELQHPEEIPRFLALMEGAGLREQDPKLREAAVTLLEQGRNERTRQREDLAAMQLLTRSLVDPNAIVEESAKWDRGKTKFEGRFRETVKNAAGALFLFETTLLNDLKRRDVDIHKNVLDGVCQSMLETLENMEPELISRLTPDAPWYDYEVENMNRILTTLDAILKAEPEEVFPDPGVGRASEESLAGSLLVLWEDRLELRKCDRPAHAFAFLPLDMPALGGSCEVLKGRKMIIAFTREKVIAWDPSISAPVAEFAVHGAYGINSVDHLMREETLESIVATTDGTVYRLKDLRQVDARLPAPKDFLDNITMLPDVRVFALSGNKIFTIMELAEIGCRERLSPAQLAGQLGRLPILGSHWETRLREEAEWYGRPIDRSETRFQHPRLGKGEVNGKVVLTLHVQLSFHVTDETVLLLDPDSDPLRIIGHFLVPRRLMANFEMQTRDKTELRMICALLSDFEHDYDLAIWARAARTAQGIIFVQEGSTLPAKRDLIHIVHANDDLCFAADDRGGLFQLSTRDKSWQEIERREESGIRGLRFLK